MRNGLFMVDQVSVNQKLEGLVKKEKTRMLLCNAVLFSTFLALQGYLLFERF